MVIGCLYLPNGSPYPGPKLDWFRRLTNYAADNLALELPIILAGDYKVMATNLDFYKPERWLTTLQEMTAKAMDRTAAVITIERSTVVVCDRGC